MSLKNELYDSLEGHGIKYIEVTNKCVNIYATDRDEVHVFPLDRYETRDELVNSVKQYFRNRT